MPCISVARSRHWSWVNHWFLPDKRHCVGTPGPRRSCCPPANRTSKCSTSQSDSITRYSRYSRYSSLALTFPPFFSKQDQLTNHRDHCEHRNWYGLGFLTSLDRRMPWRKPYRLSPGGSGWRTLALRKKFPKHHKTLCCKTGQSGDNVMNLQISCNVAGCSFYVLLQEEPGLEGAANSGVPTESSPSYHGPCHLFRANPAFGAWLSQGWSRTSFASSHDRQTQRWYRISLCQSNRHQRFKFREQIMICDDQKSLEHQYAPNIQPPRIIQSATPPLQESMSSPQETAWTGWPNSDRRMLVLPPKREDESVQTCPNTLSQTHSVSFPKILQLGLDQLVLSSWIKQKKNNTILPDCMGRDSCTV